MYEFPAQNDELTPLRGVLKIPFIRSHLYIKSKDYTVPEFLGREFGQGSRYYFSAVTIIVNIFLDAAGALYAAALVMKLIFPELSILELCGIFAIIVGAIILTAIISAKGGVQLMWLISSRMAI